MGYASLKMECPGSLFIGLSRVEQMVPDALEVFSYKAMKLHEFVNSNAQEFHIVLA